MSSSTVHPRPIRRAGRALRGSALAVLCLVVSANAQARPETFRWQDPNPDPVDEYRLYIGSSSGQYGSYFPVPNTASEWTIDVADGANVFAAVTAYANGLESAYSNEVYRGPGVQSKTGRGVFADVSKQVRASGDQDGDGAVDLVVENEVDGTLERWVDLDASEGPPVSSPIDSDVDRRKEDQLLWKLVGSGDYDGDGHGDLLWWHWKRGWVELWSMDGATATEVHVVGTLDPGWRIVGSGDYDGTDCDPAPFRQAACDEILLWNSQTYEVEVGRLIQAPGGSDLDSDLAGHWRFEEGSGAAAIDSSANGNHGTIVGSPAWVSGAEGSWALDFDFIDDHVVIPNSPSVSVTGTEITLAAWINPRDLGMGGGSRVFSKRTDSGGTDVYAMFTSGGRLWFRLDGQDMTSNGTFAVDQWLHVAMVYDGVDKRIYLNGQLDTAVPQAKSDPIDASLRPLVIGMREGEERRFNGAIDDARLYARALTADEVEALYNGETTGGGSSGETVMVTSHVGQRGAEWRIVGSGDYDGGICDLMSGFTCDDVLWWNRQTGEVEIWLLAGAAHIGGGPVAARGPHWHIKGSGDFDGDGKSDILWSRRDIADAEVRTEVWLLDGVGPPTGGGPVGLARSLDWAIAGSADYDADGKSDILWRNQVTGEVEIWHHLTW